MLRSQAALCMSTGSLEMSVFQTSLAGKIGQFATVAAGPGGADSGADAVVLSDCPISRSAGPDEAGPDEAAVLAAGAEGAASGAAAVAPQAGSSIAVSASGSNGLVWKLGSILRVRIRLMLAQPAPG
jgi:hypothetical protein